MGKAYSTLCTEFYNLTKPRAAAQEVAFYETYIKASNGPILEAMCGSGRLLIPLLEQGYAIDGVDNSDAMLASLYTRLQSSQLHATIFKQPLQQLSLPKKYGLIFIAFGSFQLISNYDEAFETLQKLRHHLLPNGILLLETFIPWDALREHIEEDHLTPPKTIQTVRTIQYPDGAEMVFTSQITTYPQEQVETSLGLYEKRVNGKIVASEESPLAVRWYYQHEMRLFLEKAGFTLLQVEEHSFPENPYATVYAACC